MKQRRLYPGLRVACAAIDIDRKEKEKNKKKEAQELNLEEDRKNRENVVNKVSEYMKKRLSNEKNKELSNDGVER